MTEPVSPVESVIPDTVKMVCEEPETVPILAERIKPAKDLKHAISLNDSFRFVRELFAGDAARMNEVVRRLGEAPSLDKAMDILLRKCTRMKKMKPSSILWNSSKIFQLNDR